MMRRNRALPPEEVFGALADDPAPWQGLDARTRVGHIHLHVSNIGREEQFYRDVLGFELMARYPPSASFLGAGGYHHHIGINTWAGEGVPAPPPDAVGLRWYTIDLPSQEAREAAVQRLVDVGIAVEPHEQGLFLRDTAANGIVLHVAEQN